MSFLREVVVFTHAVSVGDVVVIDVAVVVARRRQADESAGAELALWEKSAAGFCAGMVNSPFRVVFERVKSVMQVKAHTHIQVHRKC